MITETHEWTVDGAKVQYDPHADGDYRALIGFVDADPTNDEMVAFRASDLAEIVRRIEVLDAEKRST